MVDVVSFVLTGSRRRICKNRVASGMMQLLEGRLHRHLMRQCFCLLAFASLAQSECVLVSGLEELGNSAEPSAKMGHG